MTRDRSPSFTWPLKKQATACRGGSKGGGRSPSFTGPLHKTSCCLPGRFQCQGHAELHERWEKRGAVQSHRELASTLAEQHPRPFIEVRPRMNAPPSSLIYCLVVGEAGVALLLVGSRSLLALGIYLTIDQRDNSIETRHRPRSS